MKRISGVYTIYNLVNAKSYIGSSNHIHRRLRFHISSLTRNCHPNKHLQNAWNKYGEENFIIKIIEECENSKLSLETKEQYWITYFKPQYNFNPLATNNTGVKLSEETRKRQSDGHKGIQFSSTHIENLIKFRNQPEQILTISLRSKELWNNPETRPMMIAAGIKRAEKYRGFTHSEKTKAQMSISQANREPPTLETREKIGKASSEIWKNKTEEKKRDIRTKMWQTRIDKYGPTGRK